MNDDRQFDELLDSALSEYREAEPLTGMEERVLRRLQSQAEERRRAWRMRGAIAACAALVLVGVWVGVKKTTPSVAPRENKEIAGATKTSTPPNEGGVGRTGGAGHPEGLKPRLAPKEGANLGHPTRNTIATQPVFPTPTPLTTQEQAFMASLQGNSTAAGNDRDPDSSIAIAEIKIKPLIVSGQSSGGDQ